MPVSGNTSNFSLGTAAPLTVSAGQTATYNLTAAATGGFSGTLALSCSGAPTDGTCTVTPSSLSLSTDGLSQYVVTITTTARAMTAGVWPTFCSDHSIEAALASGFLILSLPVLLRRRERRDLGRMIVIGTALFLFLVLLSCGGASGGADRGATTGTPSGIYNLTIKGEAGSVSRTASVTLTVQ